MAINRKEPTDLTDSKWLETDQYFKASNVVNTTDEGEHLELEDTAGVYKTSGYRVSNPLALSGTAKSSNIKWTSTEPTDTDIKIYTAISDSNTVEPSKLGTHRKKITITGQTGAGTNYQVLLKVGQSSGSTGDDFHLEDKADFPTEKNDGGDLRFTSSDGTTEIPFWVESVSGSGSNKTALVWVKVSEDLGTNKDIYVYYGGGGANKSDGEDTFILFDDFDGISIDTDKWDTSDSGTGDRTFSNSVMTQTGNTGARKIIPKGLSGRISIETLSRCNGARRSFEQISFIKDANNIAPGVFYENVAGTVGWYTSPLIGGTWQSLVQLEGSGGANQWRIARGDNNGSTSVAELLGTDRSSIGSKSWNIDIGTTFTLEGLGARYVNASAILETDWVLVRKFQATEPVFNAAATEEAMGTAYQEEVSDTSIDSISTDQDLTGKYLWVRQELSTEDADATPRLSTLEVLIETAKKSLAFFKFF